MTYSLTSLRSLTTFHASLFHRIIIFCVIICIQYYIFRNLFLWYHMFLVSYFPCMIFRSVFFLNNYIFAVTYYPSINISWYQILQYHIFGDIILQYIFFAGIYFCTTHLKASCGRDGSQVFFGITFLWYPILQYHIFGVSKYSCFHIFAIWNFHGYLFLRYSP